ncbi:hypothetical protein [Mucilaginibacter kameinonensis]|uniref:hypothetical protein n=1 Tax=Mucilaginibacter kameinonensis TaxID=452286 RepID=UPI000EF84E50|nr:hypothetical protein [Mucilaginibacter kameinonensis]
MFLNGTLKNESFQFDVELFSDPNNNLTYLIQITENTYLLAQSIVMTQHLLQMSGGYIEPELLEVIFNTIDLSDQLKLFTRIRPLRELKRSYLK